MTDRELLQAIFDELRDMKIRMADVLDRLDRPRPRSPDDLVDANYFARAAGLSRVTVLQGKAGTDRVPRASKRPSLWRKGDVDRFVRERAVRCASPARKAVRLLSRKRA